MTNANAALIERLQRATLAAVGAAVPAPGRIAVLDFPAYRNVGDSAIYLGQLALFERLWGMAPSFVSVQSRVELDLIPRLLGPAPVSLNGGGKLGDHRPAHQRYREAVLERLRGRPVVQLPQSIHFDDPAALDRAARAIEAHGRFVLFVRDEPSLAIARASFACETLLCPDMAFMLGALPRPAPPSRPVVALLRSDAEARRAWPIAGRVDWSEPVRTWPTIARAASEVLRRAPPALAGRVMARRVRHYRARAMRRLQAGTALLAAGEEVVTDRLHGHILCLLLGIPHLVLDSRSGKSGATVERWTRGGDFRLAPEPDAD